MGCVGLKNYKAFFFDFDGTLVDSEGTLFEAYCHLLSSFSKQPSREEFQTYIGPSLYQISALIQKRHNLAFDVEQIHKKYLQFVEWSYESVLIKPGVEEIIEYTEAKSLKLYVVSSAPLLIVNRVLQRLGLESRFENFFTCESVEKMKPDPSIYLHALEKTSLSASEVLCFEDSVAGIKSALGAGIEVAYINNKPQSLKSFQEDDKLKHYSSFQDFLAKNYTNAYSEEK